MRREHTEKASRQKGSNAEDLISGQNTIVVIKKTEVIVISL